MAQNELDKDHHDDPEGLHGPMSSSAENLRDLETRHLVNMSCDALARSDWRLVETIQRIILEREPRNIKSLSILTQALECIRSFDALRESLRLCHELKSLLPWNDEVNTAHNLARIERLKSKIERTRRTVPEVGQGAWPATYENLPNVEYLFHCPLRQLVEYCQQAMERRDFGMVIHIQEIIIARGNGNVAGRIAYARALEAVGRLEEALEQRLVISTMENDPRNIMRIRELQTRIHVRDAMAR